MYCSISCLRFPYSLPDITIRYDSENKSQRSKSAIRHRLTQINFVTPLLIHTSKRTRRQDGQSPISKDNGLPTHPLTAIPAAATPQRLFLSGFPLNAPVSSCQVLAPHYLKKGSLNKAVSSGFLEKYCLLLPDEK